MKTKKQIKIDRKMSKKNYYQKNKEEINKKKRGVYKINKEEINMKKRENRKKIEVKQKEKAYREKLKSKEKRKISRKAYNSRNDIKEKRNSDRRKRLKNDVKYAIMKRLRCRLNHSITNYTKTGKIMSSKKYEIDFEAIIENLKPFPKDRENYHIDNIVPLVSFNLEDPSEVKIAFAPENHQWLLAHDNQSKGKKNLKGGIEK